MCAAPKQAGVHKQRLPKNLPGRHHRSKQGDKRPALADSSEESGREHRAAGFVHAADESHSIDRHKAFQEHVHQLLAICLRIVSGAADLQYRRQAAGSRKQSKVLLRGQRLHSLAQDGSQGRPIGKPGCIALAQALRLQRPRLFLSPRQRGGFLPAGKGNSHTGLRQSRHGSEDSGSRGRRPRKDVKRDVREAVCDCHDGRGAHVESKRPCHRGGARLEVAAHRRRQRSSSVKRPPDHRRRSAA